MGFTFNGSVHQAARVSSMSRDVKQRFRWFCAFPWVLALARANCYGWDWFAVVRFSLDFGPSGRVSESLSHSWTLGTASMKIKPVTVNAKYLWPCGGTVLR
jgi:hypothetical protein